MTSNDLKLCLSTTYLAKPELIAAESIPRQEREVLIQKMRKLKMNENGTISEGKFIILSFYNKQYLSPYNAYPRSILHGVLVARVSYT